MQKLSLLVTEAYKDAHQKSVEVRDAQSDPIVISFLASCSIVREKYVLFIRFFRVGHEREDGQSSSELRNARRNASGFRRQPQVRSDGMMDFHISFSIL